MDISRVSVTTPSHISPALTDPQQSIISDQAVSIRMQVDPEVLVLYALNDCTDGFFRDAENQMRLLERKIFAVPVTSFLIATDPVVRPAHIEILAQAVGMPEFGISQTDIEELQKSEDSSKKLYHSELNLLRKHSEWAEIERYWKLLSIQLSKWDKCNRIVVVLHGNHVDDNSFTTSCFGRINSTFESCICLRQDIETLAESIAGFINAGNREGLKDKVVSVDFATCSDFSSEKLYYAFERSIRSYVLDGDNSTSFKIGFFASWRRLIINSYDSYLNAIMVCFSASECLNEILRYDFVGEFSYPYHSRNNNSLGFYYGECDFAIKNKIPGYLGQFDFVKDFIFKTEGNPGFRILGDDKQSLFSFWCDLNKKPENIQNWLDNAGDLWGGVQNVLQFQDKDGRSLLSHLVTVQSDIVPGLIDRILLLGARGDQIDRDGRTPIYWSANNGCVANTNQLIGSLKRGGTYNPEQILTMINKINIRGMPPIGKAIFHGHIDMVDLLLNQKASLDWQDSDGHTPLMLACMSGRQAVVDLVLANQQSVQQINQQDNAGLTPLHYAFETKLKLIGCLLKNRANLSIKGGEYGNTPLITACHKYDDFGDILKNLREENYLGKTLRQYNKCGGWPLGIACFQQKHVLVRQLLAAGAGLSEYNDTGSALQIVCMVGDLISLGYLLEYAKEPDLQCINAQGKPLFHLVVDSNSSKVELMIQALLDKGCNPANTDRNGNTALLYTIDARSGAACNVLIQDQRVKETVNHVNAYGYTALHRCLISRNELGAELLVRSGADIAITEGNGNTALHYYVINGFLNGLRTILRHGSWQLEQCLQSKNRYGFTPFDYAKAGNNREMIQLLASAINKMN